MKILIDTKEKTIADEIYETVKELPKEQQQYVKVMIMTAKMLFEKPPEELAEPTEKVAAAN